MRDRAIFVGEPDDIVAASVRAGAAGDPRLDGAPLPRSPATSPGSTRRRSPTASALRAELGYGDEPVCVVAVGGSGVGAPLLHRAIEALPPRASAAGACGWSSSPGRGSTRRRCRQVDGVEVRGYVHELYRHLAACDVAVVQGGLTTTMELVAAGRPFVSTPAAPATSSSASTCATGSTATARRRVSTTSELSPETLGATLAQLRDSDPSYLPVDGGGAARAASLIAELL